ARDAFARQTGFPNGRPGYVIDHIRPLACGRCRRAIQYTMADDRRRSVTTPIVIGSIRTESRTPDDDLAGDVHASIGLGSTSTFEPIFCCCGRLCLSGLQSSDVQVARGPTNNLILMLCNQCGTHFSVVAERSPEPSKKP